MSQQLFWSVLALSRVVCFVYAGWLVIKYFWLPAQWVLGAESWSTLESPFQWIAAVLTWICIASILDLVFFRPRPNISEVAPVVTPQDTHLQPMSIPLSPTAQRARLLVIAPEDEDRLETKTERLIP